MANVHPKASEAVRELLAEMRKAEKDAHGWQARAAARLGLRPDQVSRLADEETTTSVGVATAGRIAQRALTWDENPRRRLVWQRVAEEAKTADAFESAVRNGAVDRLPATRSAMADDMLALVLRGIDEAKAAGDDAEVARLKDQLIDLTRLKLMAEGRIKP